MALTKFLPKLALPNLALPKSFPSWLMTNSKIAKTKGNWGRGGCGQLELVLTSVLFLGSAFNLLPNLINYTLNICPKSNQFLSPLPQYKPSSSFAWILITPSLVFLLLLLFPSIYYPNQNNPVKAQVRSCHLFLQKKLQQLPISRIKSHNTYNSPQSYT